MDTETLTKPQLNASQIRIVPITSSLMPALELFCDKAKKLGYENNSSIEAMKLDWCAEQGKWFCAIKNREIIAVGGCHPLLEVGPNAWRILFRGCELPNKDSHKGLSKYNWYSVTWREFIPAFIEWCPSNELYITTNTDNDHSFGKASRNHKLMGLLAKQNILENCGIKNLYYTDQTVWKLNIDEYTRRRKEIRSIQVKPKTTTARSYYIAFNEDGRILQITNSPKKLISEKKLIQVESTNPICGKIIQGKASLKKYGMIWDVIDDRWDIDKRSTTLVIETRHNKLLPFALNVSSRDTEIYIKAFSNSNKIVITSNNEKIKTSKNLADIKSISTDQNDILDVYITKRNDPDYLLSTINIDPLTLFKKGVQVIDLKSNIQTQLDWNKISLYTKPVFNDYGWTVLKTFKPFLMDRNAREITKTLQSSTVEDDADININVVDNTMHIQSSIVSEQLYYFDGQSNLKVIVCDKEVDNLVGAFEVSVDQLLNKLTKTDLTFKWPNDPLLLYKNNYIRVSTGEKHEQDAKH